MAVVKNIILGTKIIALVSVLLLAGHHNIAQGDSFKIHQVKAVVLYNVIHFVSWPAKAFKSRHAPLRICVLGEDPVKGVLERVVKGELLNKRRLVVENISHLKDLKDCHILFISTSFTGQLTEIIKSLENTPVLTVGDVKGFAHQGGMVNLVAKKNKVHVEINLKRVKRSGLKFSKGLLKLVTVVQDATSSDN